MFPIIIEFGLSRLFPRNAKTAMTISSVGAALSVVPGVQKEPSPGLPKPVGVMLSGGMGEVHTKGRSQTLSQTSESGDSGARAGIAFLVEAVREIRSARASSLQLDQNIQRRRELRVPFHGGPFHDLEARNESHANEEHVRKTYIKVKRDGGDLALRIWIYM